MERTSETNNFIRQIVLDDVRSGRVKEVVTRFPPEPNGYLHIGHAKAIWINLHGRANLAEKRICGWMIRIRSRKMKNM